jgi:hypothetical protein
MSLNFKELLSIKKAKAGVDDGANEPLAAPTGTPAEEVKKLKRYEKVRGDKKREIARSGKKAQPPSKSGTLAIGIIIIDSLPHEDIWRRWAEDFGAGNDGVKVQFLVHAKFPDRVKSEWVKQRLTKVSFAPEWGSIELVRAALQLVEEAVENPQVQRFVLASESCIPIVPLADAIDSLWASSASWVHAWHAPDSGNEKYNQFFAVPTETIPETDVWKADQWVMLTRDHAKLLLELPQRVGMREGYQAADGGSSSSSSSAVTAQASTAGSAAPSTMWQCFKPPVFAPDEIYVPTCLSILQLMRESEGVEPKEGWNKWTQAQKRSSDKAPYADIQRRMVTFVDWPRPRDGKSPKAFMQFDEGVMRKAVANGCLFARKFAAGTVELRGWEKLVLAGRDAKRSEQESASGGAGEGAGGRKRKFEGEDRDGRGDRGRNGGGGDDRRGRDRDKGGDRDRGGGRDRDRDRSDGGRDRGRGGDDRGYGGRDRDRDRDRTSDRGRHDNGDRDRDRDDRGRGRNDSGGGGSGGGSGGSSGGSSGGGRRLVIVPCGDDSLHTNWCPPKGEGGGFERRYDLWVNYFGSDEKVKERYASMLHLPDKQAGKSEGGKNQPRDRMFTFKGSKWSIFRQILREHWDDWRTDNRYSYIWFPDDDLELSAPNVDRFIDICESHDVCLAQPSLKDQYVTHDIVKQQRGVKIRFTNFVEIQGPLFHADVLEHVIWPTLSDERVKSAWGLDYVWSHLLRRVWQDKVSYEVKLAIVDAVMMVHTKPPAKGIAADGKRGDSFYDKQKIDPEQEMKDTLAIYSEKLRSYKVGRMQFLPRTLRVVRDSDTSGAGAASSHGRHR